MINHVVLFKLKAYDSEQEKTAVMNNINESLLALKEKINELKYIEVGKNYQLETKSFDICLISHFETIADMEAYAIHPEHLKVLALIRENMVDRAAVDFEF